MANEDEKVLIVPPFGRKDIQEIANEGDEADSYDEVVALVDKAIQNGDVPSGAKVYQHTLSRNNSNKFIVFDNDSSPITSDNAYARISQALTYNAVLSENPTLPDYFVGMCLLFKLNGFAAICVVKYEIDDRGRAYFTTPQYDISLIDTSYVDTVTEL